MAIRFDDIEAINANISDDYGDWGPTFEMTQDKVNQFADLTGDRQWIHVDVERAQRESPFGGPIAHGFFTLSVLPGINRSISGLEGFTSGVNYGANKLRFLSPVPVPSELRCRSRLLGAHAKGSGTLLTSEVMIHVVGSERPAVLYEMLTLLM